MLTQERADALMAMEKQLLDSTPIQFPIPGEMRQLQVRSVDGHESFLVDVNRKGRIKLTKCTYQERYAAVDILVRVDIDGPPHDNPDGTTVPCPHIHVYREGYADKWAEPLPLDRFTNPSDLARTLRDFLSYCKVTDIPDIQKGVL